jgi:hypothetical protein
MNARTAIYISACIFLLLGGCDPIATDVAPVEKRVVVFWDLSQSITSDERQAWVAQLKEDLRERRYGGTLYYEDQKDEVLMLPVYGSTRTSGFLIEQLFPGGPGNKKLRVLAYRQYFDELDRLHAIRTSREALRHTDLISAITRYAELGVETAAEREICFFSDMMHSVPALDFERGPAMPHDQAAALARRTIDQQSWPSNLLEGASVKVRLPSSLAGRPGFSDARMMGVKSFWVTLFQELGSAEVNWLRR